jgi:hypothetical protein
MLLNKVELTTSLCKLTEADSSLINYIIADYVSMIDDKKFDDLELYVNKNINELI